MQGKGHLLPRQIISPAFFENSWPVQHIVTGSCGNWSRMKSNLRRQWARLFGIANCWGIGLACVGKRTTLNIWELVHKPSASVHNVPQSDPWTVLPRR